MFIMQHAHPQCWDSKECLNRASEKQESEEKGRRDAGRRKKPLCSRGNVSAEHKLLHRVKPVRR